MGVAHAHLRPLAGHSKVTKRRNEKFSIDAADAPFKKKVCVASTITYSLKD